MSRYETIALIIAAYAALLSTALAVRQFLERRRSLKVSCRLAVASPPGVDVSEFVSVQAVNVGLRPVEVKSAGLLMTNGSVFSQLASRAGPVPLPKKLADGESVTVLFDLDKARLALRDADVRGLRYTQGFVQDAEGRQYASKVPTNIHLPPNLLFGSRSG